MAAVISSTGTFTALSTTLPGATDDAGNVPQLYNVVGSDLSSVPSEVTQFIQLLMVAYGIPFWPACVLLRTWLTALINKAAPVVN